MTEASNESLAGVPVARIPGGPFTVVVVHGGPGMDFSYMRALDDLAGPTDLSVVYYEQTPRRDQSVTGASSQHQVDELKKVIDAASDDSLHIGLVAHSWGTFLALEALSDANTRDKVSVAALINPVPLTWERIGEAGNRLMARVHREDLDAVEAYEQDGGEAAGKALMDLIGYAYLAPTSDPSDLSVGRYNPDVNASVLGSIVDYDQRPLARDIARETRIGLFYGEHDFLLPVDTEELHLDSTQVTLSASGHFPFVESPSDLLPPLRRFLIGE